MGLGGSEFMKVFFDDMSMGRSTLVLTESTGINAIILELWVRNLDVNLEKHLGTSLGPHTSPEWTVDQILTSDAEDQHDSGATVSFIKAALLGLAD